MKMILKATYKMLKQKLLGHLKVPIPLLVILQVLTDPLFWCRLKMQPGSPPNQR